MPGTYPGWKWSSKPPLGTPLDAASPLRRGLLAAFNPQGPARFTDPLGNLWAPTNGPVAAPGPTGAAFRYDGTSSYHSCSSLVLPTASCTVALIIYAASSTGEGSTFGQNDSTDDRLQSHFPFDGVIYWDFGDPSSPNRISWTPPTGFFADQSTPTPWHRVVFRAGKLGSSIWSDGLKRATSATAITRLPGSAGFSVGAWPAKSFYNANAIELLLLSGREWSDAEIVSWSASPYQLFQAPAPRRFFAPSSGGTDPGTGSGTLGHVTGSGSGSGSDAGSGSGTLRHVTGSGAGAQADVGAGSGTTGRVSGSGSGTQLDSGSGSGTAARVAASGAGSQLDAGSGSPSTGRVIGSGAGTQADAGSGAGTIGRVTGEGFSTPVNPGSGSGTTGEVSGSLAGSATDPGSGAGTLGHVTGSGSSTPTDPGSGAGTAARVTGSAAGSQIDAGSGAGTVGRVIGSGASTPGNTGAGSGTTGRVTGSGSGSSSPATAGIYWANSYFAATYFAPTYWPGVTVAVVVSAIADPDETIFELLPAVPSPWDTVFELSSPSGSSGEGSSYWPHAYFAPSFFAPPYWGGATAAVLDTESIDFDATAFELVPAVPVPWETVFVLI